MKQTSIRPNMKRLTLTALLTLNLFGCTNYVVSVPEQGATLTHWRQARDYQAQGRLELAKHQYTLALAASQTPDAQAMLQRDLLVIDRMLQAMR